jgi:hypothetical protein
MTKPRTAKRASSRAHKKCPHCGKRLNGSKGLAMHITLAHETTGKAGVK